MVCIKFLLTLIILYQGGLLKLWLDHGCWRIKAFPLWRFIRNVKCRLGRTFYGSPGTCHVQITIYAIIVEVPLWMFGQSWGAIWKEYGWWRTTKLLLWRSWWRRIRSLACPIVKCCHTPYIDCINTSNQSNSHYFPIFKVKVVYLSLQLIFDPLNYLYRLSLITTSLSLSIALTWYDPFIILHFFPLDKSHILKVLTVNLNPNLDRQFWPSDLSDFQINRFELYICKIIWRKWRKTGWQLSNFDEIWTI